MTVGEFRKLKYFNEHESWGDISLLHLPLIQEMDKGRSMSGRPWYVTYGTQGKHADGSLHYAGKAVDFVMNAEGLNIYDTLFLMMRLKFDGIGIYPDAVYPGIKKVVGFHVEFNEKRSAKGLWIGRKNEDGSLRYTGVTQKTIEESGLPRA